MLSAVSSSHPRQPSGTFILGLSRKHLWATDDALPPRPLDDVAVLDAPTPPSSRGGSLHLRVSGLQERANTSCVALPADVYLTYLTDIDNNKHISTVRRKQTLLLGSDHNDDEGAA